MGSKCQNPMNRKRIVQVPVGWLCLELVWYHYIMELMVVIPQRSFLQCSYHHYYNPCVALKAHLGWSRQRCGHLLLQSRTHLNGSSCLIVRRNRPVLVQSMLCEIFSSSGLVKDINFQGDHTTASLWKSSPLSSIQRGQKEDQQNVQWWRLEFAGIKRKFSFRVGDCNCGLFSL